MYYIFLDNEMGGTELEYSLLSSYFLATDDNFKSVGYLSLFLKPDDGRYIIRAESMGVNKIDLCIHDLKSKTYKESGTILYNWLKVLTEDGKNKLTPVGHGIYGDIQFIIKYLISHGSWDKFVSYRKIDTQGICQFLKTCGLFPDDVSGSLESLGKYFNISIDEKDLHTAKGDTELTLQVFLKLRELLTNYKTSGELEKVYYERRNV